MPDDHTDEAGALERARERLYSPARSTSRGEASLLQANERTLPHAWHDDALPLVRHRGRRKVRVATAFFIASFIFFLVAFGVAGYFLYFGGNTVSVDKVSIGIQGPTSIAGGDTVPLSVTVTNHNPAAIQNATIEIDFPSGTRSASNMLSAYPRYTANLGMIPSGGTVVRSVKAVLFGAAGQTLSLPVLFSYGITGSNATFVKKSTYPIAISSTPLSVSVDTLAETVSGKPLTLTLTVRSNATIPLDSVVLAGVLPFGFSVASSSMPMTDSSFVLGTLAPGATRTITLTGTLSGQDQEQSVFHFTVGTADAADATAIAITYMTQDATVTIAAPFISTTLAVNGDTASNPVLTPGTSQNVTVSYANTLSTSVTNANVAITLSGAGVDYGSVQTDSGFYDSSTHTILFSSNTDPSLASLAPGATGVGSFTFKTLSASSGVVNPSVTFTTSVSGTRVGQTNVPEQVSASASETARVTTAVAFSLGTLHTSGPFANSGPVPPVANQSTTYTIRLVAQDEGAPIAGGTASLTLPPYVTYTGKTSGTGSMVYDSASRTVSWNVGDLSQGATASAYFQVSLMPSTSQKTTAPTLTSAASFSGYDRYAGVQISGSASPADTQTTGDPGYTSADAVVQ